jgi:hypothetical protein
LLARSVEQIIGQLLNGGVIFARTFLRVCVNADVEPRL